MRQGPAARTFNAMGVFKAYGTKAGEGGSDYASGAAERLSEIGSTLYVYFLPVL